MRKWIDINKKRIGANQPCFIIAEAGVNHDGDIQKALDLIDIAVEAGVDAVKFQTWITEELLTKNIQQADYQKKNTGKEESQYAMLKKLELSQSDFIELKNYCEKKDIIFLSTPDEEKSADFLEQIGVPLFKIGSGELTNLPFLKYIALKNKPIILSTGMSNLEEIEKAVEVIVKSGNESLILLHCTSEYPTSLSDVNLNAMITLKTNFSTIVGYSDHTIGNFASIVAASMDAKVIEKHFTYDKNALGPDHKCSLSPNELKNLVKEIRDVEMILGSFEKKPTKIEKNNLLLVRKSIVAKKALVQGDLIAENNVSMKRSSGNIAPSELNAILGKKLKRNIDKDDPIMFDDLYE